MTEGGKTATDPPPQVLNNTDHLGPRKFAMDFLKTKEIDLSKPIKTFMTFNKTSLNKIMKEVEPLFMGTSFHLWEAIQKKDQARQINAAI